MSSIMNYDHSMWTRKDILQFISHFKAVKDKNVGLRIDCTMVLPEK